jgi:hypothetical protein
MAPLAHYTLMGNVVACVLGALVLAIVAYRYGFASPLDEPSEMSVRRVVFSRLAHAVAAACFAIAAMLGVMTLWIETSAPARGGDLPASGARTTGEVLRDVDERLRATQGAMADIDRNIDKVLSRLEKLEQSRR